MMTVKSLANKRVTLKTGEQLAYFDSNPMADTATPVLVLLHGYCGSSAYFQRLIPLLDSHIRVLAPDLIGHGQSDPVDESCYKMEQVASWIDEWLINIGIEKAYVMGHSLGGYITLALAEAKPAYLCGFGLLHSTALPDSEQAKQNREGAIQTVQNEGVSTFVKGLVPKLFAEGAEIADIELARLIGDESASESVIAFARGMKERVDRRHVIHEATIPVLLISGAKDKIVQAEGTFAGHNNETLCQIIDDAGHMSMIETPDQLANLLLSFTGKQ